MASGRTVITYTSTSLHHCTAPLHCAIAQHMHRNEQLRCAIAALHCANALPRCAAPRRCTTVTHHATARHHCTAPLRCTTALHHCTAPHTALPRCTAPLHCRAVGRTRPVPHLCGKRSEGSDGAGHVRLNEKGGSEGMGRDANGANCGMGVGQI